MRLLEKASSQSLKVVRKLTAFGRFRGILVSGTGIMLVLGCTENPFDNSKIGTGFRQIRGSVRLSDGQASEGTYIWLEGFKIGSRADAAGRFQITLPSPSAQGVPGGHSGVFKLYFYMANYKLAYSQAVVRNGEFAYGQGDINKNGDLSVPKFLEKFLRISIEATPSTISPSFADDLYVTLALQALGDSVTVVFPRLFEDMVAKAFLKRTGSDDYYVLLTNAFGAVRGNVEVIRSSPFSRTMAFAWRPGTIPPGDYDVIPYFLVRHEIIPPELMESLGPRVGDFGPDYLHLPFRREGGRLVVLGSSSE